MKSSNNGLKVVFNSSGKNPYGHDIGECVNTLRRMQMHNVLAAIIIVPAVILTGVSLLLILVLGFSTAKILFAVGGLVMIAVSASLMIHEYGQNIIDVADQWRMLISRLDRLGIDVEGMQSGHQVASVFESRLVKVVSEKIAAEKAGMPKKLKETERLFNKIRNLALELKLEVSSREDFFKGRGAVWFRPAHQS
jgi:hypothetical protein